MWPFKIRTPVETPAVPQPTAVAVADSVFERSTLNDPVSRWYRGDVLDGGELTVEQVQVCAVYSACVDLLASSMAALPVHVYAKRPDGGREEQPAHPYTRLLAEPAPDWTRVEWLEYLVRALAYRGAGYCRVERQGSLITALVPMDPAKVTTVADQGRLAGYRYEKEILLPDEVLCVKWRSRDGIVGEPPWRGGERAILLALQEEAHALNYFRNACVLSGVIEGPPEVQLSVEATKRMLQQFNEAHQGSARAHRVTLLDGGMSFKLLGNTAEQAELSESRRLSVESVCRLLATPPSMISDFSRATWANSETAIRFYAQMTVSPLAVRIGASLNKLLFPPPSRTYLEVEVAGLLRGSFSEQAEYVAKLVSNGVMTANEAREHFNLPRHEDGDKLAATAATAPLASTVNVAPPAVCVESSPVSVVVEATPRPRVERVVTERDSDGFPLRVTETELPPEELESVPTATESA